MFLLHLNKTSHPDTKQEVFRLFQPFNLFNLSSTYTLTSPNRQCLYHVPISGLANTKTVRDKRTRSFTCGTKQLQKIQYSPCILYHVSTFQRPSWDLLAFFATTLNHKKKVGVAKVKKNYEYYAKRKIRNGIFLYINGK